MFPKDLSLQELNDLTIGNMCGHLGIEFIEFGSEFLKARMPVDSRTRQPMGLLHGGASVVLAETLGGVSSTCMINRNNQAAVGIEINANHLRSAREGYVIGICTPIHIGKSTHVWEIRIENEQLELISVSRITVMIKDLR